MLLETVLDNPEKNDYVDLAKQSAVAYEHTWEAAETDLDKLTSADLQHRHLIEYTGSYYKEV